MSFLPSAISVSPMNVKPSMPSLLRSRAQSLLFTCYVNGKKEIVRVEVEQRQTAAQRQPLAATDRVWGVKVAEIRKDSTFYHRTGQDGLLVLKTSSHLYLDLHLGDFIVTMDGIAVNSVEQFRQYLEKNARRCCCTSKRKAGNYLYVLLKKAKKNKNERVE